jgi:hypothetical protein
MPTDIPPTHIRDNLNFTSDSITISRGIERLKKTDNANLMLPTENPCENQSSENWALEKLPGKKNISHY